VFGRVQNEILREVHETREDLRQDREAHRQFTAEMTLQLRQMGVENRAANHEIIEELRAHRQALLAVLDRLPPPGEARA